MKENILKSQTRERERWEMIRAKVKNFGGNKKPVKNTQLSKYNEM